MIFTILILAALGVIAIVTMLNTLTFPRLRRNRFTPVTGLPFVSVLVPARDEADVIGSTVAELLKQDYPNYELLILDDHSQDGTSEIVMQAAQGDMRLLLLQSQALPPGWTGKNWACQQLGKQARGEILVFTDADVHWEESALFSLVQAMQRSGASVFTVWPVQETYTWSERLVVPMMMFAIFGYLPELAVRYAPFSSLAAANGQCLAFQHSAYDRIGGHFAVRSNVVEDLALARRTKRARLRLVMALGNGLIRGRMYESWVELRSGFAKNILAGHGGYLPLLLSTVFHWTLFILPWLWLAVGFVIQSTGWPTVPLAMIALGAGARALSAAATRSRILDALLLPVSVFLMTIIAGQSIWWQLRYGGPQWKGRVLSKDN